MRYLLLTLLILSSTACKRRKPEPPPPPPVAAPAVREPTLNELNEAIQAWFTSRGRPPESFEEMAQARFIPHIPTPPPGRRYLIDKDKLRVVLQ